MEPMDEPDNLNERLLPPGKPKSEDGDPDFQSCKSDDGDGARQSLDKREIDNSINSSKLDMGQEESKEKFRLNIEETKSPNEEGSDMTTSRKNEENSSRLPRSINFASPTKKKSKGKSIWSEILDFIFFCYEFIMIMLIIGTGSLLPAIPNSIYVFLAIIYLGIQIIINDVKKSLAVCTVIMGLLLVISLIFLIFKIIFSILIHGGNLSYNENLYLGLGIAINPNSTDGWDVVRTFLSDITTVIVSMLLFVGCIIRSRRNSHDLDEDKIETLKVTGARSPSFWISVCILFIGLAGIISPSAIAFCFAVFCSIGLYTWALFYDLNGPIMLVITY